MALIKSVSGVRGIVRSDNAADITMDAGVARRMGRAYATYLTRRSEDARGLLLVGGRDGRAGGDALLASFAEGARASGVKVLDVGVVTTPGVAMVVKAMGAAGGVVMTASHNPAEWNGIKLMTPDGAAPVRADADVIFSLFDGEDFEDEPVEDRPVRTGLDPHEHHVGAVLKTVDVERIRTRGFTVVLDSINGAGATAGRLLLERLGCRIEHVNAEPAATFAHTPEPIEANLGTLCERVRREGVDVGFAQDPDADRLAIVDETGRFIGEEYTLALCARRVLTTRPGPAAANLSTSRMIDDIAVEAGCVVHRSAVGEANVVEAMKSHDCVIGGEGNGGVIDPRVVYVRDSIVSMALVLDLMAAHADAVSMLADALPSYAMLKDKVSCDSATIALALTATREAFSDGVTSEVDGVRIDWPDKREWMHVRGSNTEPIMRIIVEAVDAEAAGVLMARSREVIRSARA